jgi:uncharacterized protein YccT (UPF0319 family)
MEQQPYVIGSALYINLINCCKNKLERSTDPIRTFILTRLFYSFCFILLASVVSVSVSATTLNVSDNLTVTEINNKIVEHGLLNTKSTFVLSRGSHALVLHYKDVFEDLEFAEYRVVESKPFVVKFTVNKEVSLNLNTVVINNLAQAESFAKAPTLLLSDESQKEIEIVLTSVNDYKISQQVDIALNTYTSKQSNENVKDTINLPTTNVDKAIQAKALSSILATPTVIKKSGNTLIQVNSLNMLKYWWQNASNEEKEHFKRHIAIQK